MYKVKKKNIPPLFLKNQNYQGIPPIIKNLLSDINNTFITPF